MKILWSREKHTFW